MAVTDRHVYGWAKERELTPRVSEFFGDKVSRSLYRYEHTDFETDLYFAELKSRRTFDSKFYDSWMVPCCKFDKVGKEICILYHWDGDDSMWYYIYDRNHQRFFTYTLNENGQPTWLVPKWLFTPAE